MADTDLFPTEPPQYPTLGTAIASVWTKTRRDFRALRRRWFEILGVEDPGGRGARQAKLLQRARQSGKASRLCARKALTNAQKAALDAALEEFLRSYAGEDRSRTGFVDAEAETTLQQSEFLAYEVGVRRGRQLAGGQNLELTEAAREALLRDAFDRMSEGGRLRFESRLEEIRGALVAGLEAGDNPLDVAARLAGDCDAYERGRLELITRTEMGIASEQGIRDLYTAEGITRVEVIGDPNTDEACTVHIGEQYDLGDTDNLPIYHPQCLCSTVPVVENQ